METVRRPPHPTIYRTLTLHTSPLAEAYFAYPPDKQTSTCILFLTDVIGHTFINAQLMADQFAANGYFVCMPDLFHGDAIPLNKPPGFNWPKWLNGPPGHTPERVDPLIEEAVKTLRGSEYGVKKLGAVGYCFGAKYVIRGLKEGGGIDAGFIAHPSLVEAEELKRVNGPLSIAAAGTFAIKNGRSARCDRSEIALRTC